MDKKRKYSGKGYIIKDYKVPKNVYEFFWGLTEKFKFKGNKKKKLAKRKNYHRFICHIYVSTRLKGIENEDFDRDITAPIYSRLIEKKFKGDIDVDFLVEEKIIKYRNHSHGKGIGKSREFRLISKIYKKAIKLTECPITDDWESLINCRTVSRRYNLFTLKQKNTIKTNQYCLYTNSGKKSKLPNIIKESMASLTPCPIDPHNLIPWVKKVKAKYDREQKHLIKVRKLLTKKYPELREKDIKEKNRYKAAAASFRKAQGLYANIILSMETIISQNPKPIKQKSKSGKTLWSYPAAYRPGSTGRVYEIHGGFQNVCTPVKELLLDDVPNIHNYDLKNSQAMILLLEFKKADIKCKWLERYLKNTKLRAKYAERVGISEGCWKSCFYSLVMGAEVKEYGAIMNNILTDIPDYNNAKTALKRFKKITKSLIKASEKWREFLLTTTNKNYTYKSKLKFWRNACNLTYKDYGINHEGDKIEIIDPETGEIIKSQHTRKKMKRDLAAFFLQGREAFYTHHLTVLCVKHGIPVYKNEHDGLITGKEIPENIQRKAARIAKLGNIKLEKKDICNDYKRNKYNKYINS